jgi:hypothetical protein
LTFISLPVEAITPYFLLNLILDIKWSCAFSSFFFYLPKLRSHILIVLSSDAEYRYFPFGWIDNERIQLSWPIKVANCYPVWQMNNFIILSRPPVNKNVWWYEFIPFNPYSPNFFNALILLYWVNLDFNNYEFINYFDCYPYTSKIVYITLSWAKNLFKGAYLSICHIHTLWSSEQLAINLLSALTTTLLTHF